MNEQNVAAEQIAVQWEPMSLPKLEAEDRRIGFPRRRSIKHWRHWRPSGRHDRRPQRIRGAGNRRTPRSRRAQRRSIKRANISDGDGESEPPIFGIFADAKIGHHARGDS